MSSLKDKHLQLEVDRKARELEKVEQREKERKLKSKHEEGITKKQK